MSRSSVNVLVFGLAAVLALSACDRGEKRNSTANNQLLKAQCYAGFNTQKFAKQREAALSAKFGNEKVIRTYVSKLATTGGDPALALVNESSIKLISSQSITTFAQKNDEFKVVTGDEVIVEANCANLTADVTAPGLHIEGLNFVVSKKGKNQITLEKMDDKIGKIKVLVEKIVLDDSAAQKNADAAGETTLKVTFSSEGSVAQNLEIVQKSGAFTEKSIIDLDSSVTKLIAQRSGEKAPKEITDFAKKAGAGDITAEPNGENKVTSHVVPQSALSISEAAVLSLEEVLAQAKTDIVVSTEVVNGKILAGEEDAKTDKQPAPAAAAPEDLSTN